MSTNKELDAQIIALDAKREQEQVRPPPLTIEQWLTRALPEPDFIMGHWLATTSRVLPTADTGLGKTNFSMAMGMHGAAGEPFLHWHAPRRSNVLYIDGEMSRRLMKQRIADGVRRLGQKPIGFHAFSHEDIEDFAPLNTPTGQQQIETIIKMIGRVDLIIFDSVMCLIAGDMKDEEPWKLTLPWVRLLTKRNIAQLWINHTGHDVTRGYGTKTREWQMDTVLHMDRVEHPATDLSFGLRFTKARERTPETRRDFEDVHITLIDDAWTFEGASPSKQTEVSPAAKKFLAALTDVLAGGSILRNNRPTTTFDLWWRECFRMGLLDREAKPNAIRALQSKYRVQLIAANLIACDEEYVWKIR